ncbi:hypothetical protein N181_23295 [Sinorhizobium fredii USDA 205]|uniref:Uncharacterized protein n=1 Tax=Rhizobium fredii TaxID=380 RepID=A0A844A3R8_RHIFR|nr:hypothetical protein [Sinorhizobium fredii]KSV85585.1 hypothetical protein N181_23295 [Sinorhizobium fredii USDA 205]MQX06778.1 hypothetical protein [Sinorhizobium fredii]GEC34048.1 hypothetical protein EFR01_42190 [Sinorhizobium fredii]GLS06411.1 hypothetical protein GCM10007864_00350 [Sinorhizobium fredii]
MGIEWRERAPGEYESFDMEIFDGFIAGIDDEVCTVSRGIFDEKWALKFHEAFPGYTPDRFAYVTNAASKEEAQEIAEGALEPAGEAA